jgi:hypothetical protein
MKLSKEALQVKKELFARALAEGKNLHDAMLVAGYAESQAKRGAAALSKDLASAYADRKLDKAKELIELGRRMRSDIELAKDVVFGRLSQNSMEGTDAGTVSAKALGSIKELDCFTKDVVVGVQINQLSPTLEKLITLEAEES